MYLTGHQEVKKVKKWDCSMIRTKHILMPSKVRLKILGNVLTWNNGDKKTTIYQN